MKMLAVVAVLAALMTGATSVQAKETLFSKDAAKSLVGVPAAELPATVVSLVKVAPKASQPAVVDALVRRVAKMNPAALRAVVVALAKADASWAPIAAASAAKASPDSVSQIAVAACGAAPDQAAKIVAVCSKVTVVSRAALAEVVSATNPSFNAITLAQQSSQIRVEMAGGSADAATGGVVWIFPPTSGNLGSTMNGEEVVGDPAPAPSQDGVDPNRYGAAGS
jgi:hypothetical protein